MALVSFASPPIRGEEARAPRAVVKRTLTHELIARYRDRAYTMAVKKCKGIWRSRTFGALSR